MTKDLWNKLKDSDQQKTEVKPKTASSLNLRHIHYLCQYLSQQILIVHIFLVLFYPFARTDI